MIKILIQKIFNKEEALIKMGAFLRKPLNYDYLAIVGVGVLTCFILFAINQLIFQDPSLEYSQPTFSILNNQKNDEAPITSFQLKIPKISVDVPIIANVDGTNEEAYFKALEDGVAHYKGTAKPGEGGNIFIFGHSAYYPNKPGNYKQVFRYLTKLKKGDEIEIDYQDKIYYYIVTRTKTVKPNQVEVLAPTPEEQLSLMTCVPPGTTKYRLIVIAKPK